MKKIFGAVLAVALLATSLTPGVAYADERGRGHYRHSHHDRGDDALAAGVVGLALGAMLGSSLSDRRRGYYDDSYYRGGAYRDGYYGDGYYRRPALCIRRERRYDPYYDRTVIVEERYRC